MIPAPPRTLTWCLALVLLFLANRPVAGAPHDLSDSGWLHGGPDVRAWVSEGGGQEGSGGGEQSPARDSELLVLAAASLMDALPQVARLWSNGGGAPVRFSFDATSRLAPQVLAGIQADLFFSADESWMDWLEERGGIDPASRIDLLANDLAVIISRKTGGPGARIGSPEDLTHPAVRHLALAGENVPAGRYARAALENTGVWDDVAGKVVRAGNVRGAQEWVALREVEAGVVYRTDAVSEDRVLIAFTFDPHTHPPIRYPAAVLSTAPEPELARAFLDFCQTPEAQAVFRDAGFRPVGVDPPEALADMEGNAGPGAASAEVARGNAAPNPWSAIRLSFLVALAATILGFIPAVWLGWILARKDFYGKSLISTVALVPLVLPPVVTGFILLSILGAQSPVGRILERIGLPVPFTLLGATVAALAVGFPLYVISVRNAFQTVDASYEAVAWTLGVRPWQAFLRVTFPLALPGIVAGSVLAFARALGEFGATVVLAGNLEGSTRTIALAVYTLLESPEGRESIWILVGASALLSLLALLGFEALSRHQRRQMGIQDGR